MKKSTFLKFFDGICNKIICCLLSKKIVSESNSLQFEDRNATDFITSVWTYLWRQTLVLPIVMVATLMTGYTTTAQNIQGRAPVKAPLGGFAVDGNAFVEPLSSTMSMWGDFLFAASYIETDPNVYKAQSPGGIFVPVPPDYTYPDGPLPSTFYVYPNTTFFRDNITNNDPTIFTSTNKINDPVSTMTWGSGSSPNKNEIQNAIAHFTFGDPTIKQVVFVNGSPVEGPYGNPNDLWMIFAADRQVTNGSSYIDFEILQKRFTITNDGTDSKGNPKGGFASEAGTPSGRTDGDILVTIEFTQGGVSANVVVRQWEGNEYVTFTPDPGTVFGTNNTEETLVPYPIYGQAPFSTVPLRWKYEQNQWAEGAVNVTSFFGSDPCFKVSTLFVRTRTSGSSGTSELKDFPGEPFQLDLDLNPSVTIGKNNVTCNGSNNGVVTITSASGYDTLELYRVGTGTPSAADVLIKTQSNANDFTGLMPGSYYVKAIKGTGDNACPATSPTVTITEPILVTVSASSTNVSCKNAADGTITISGVSAGATTKIQKDGTGSDLSGQTAFGPGTYVITATAPDGNNPPGTGVCTKTASVTITEPILVTVSASSTNVSCKNAADGTITISGVSAGATTKIQKDGTGSDLSGQTAFGPGTYVITATAPDGNNPPGTGVCTKTASVTITEPILVTVSASSTNVSCKNAADGTITISGVSAGATTKIQKDGTGSDLSGQTAFGPGTYVITATAPDGNNPPGTGVCTKTASVTITEPILVTVSASSTNVSCKNAADGTITISGVSAGATTKIQKDGTGSDLSGQTAFGPGTYVITATAPDGNNPPGTGVCTKTASVTITEPILVTVSASSTNVSCKNAADGTITISGVSAGATTKIQKDGTGSDLSGQTAFGPGTYVITATAPDGNNPPGTGVCTKTASVTITEPILVTVSASSTNVSCKNAADGTITISGVSAGATTKIQKDGTGSDLSGQTAFGPGTYVITATAPDGNNPPGTGVCTKTASVTITEPILVTVSASSTNVSCKNAADGTITISGVSAGATTKIQKDGTGSDLSGQTAFGPGTYVITATAPDGNNPPGTGVCTKTASVTITEPILVTVSASSTNVSCKNAADGTITISGVSAGATTKIQKDGTGSDLSGQTAFGPGTYVITATAPDGNNPPGTGVCTKTASVTITEPILVTVSASSTNVSCKNAADGTITISGVSAGATTKIQKDGTGSDLSGQTAFGPGTYVITATAPDGNNPPGTGVCTKTASVTITEPILVTVSASSTNVSCKNAADGTITISGVSAGATTKIQKDGTGSDLSGQTAFGPGTYVITATAPDGNNPPGTGVCTKTASVTITEPILVTVSASSTNVSCKNAADGTITISGVSAGATTKIQKDGTGSDLSGQTAFGPGTYVITATAPDGNNPPGTGVCTKTASVTITEPILVTVSASSTNVSCKNAADGTITISGVSAGATTKIQKDGTGSDLSGQTAFGPGTYVITATAPDGNNPPGTGVCIKTTSVTITEPDALSASALPTAESCAGGDGSMVLTFSGGTSPYMVNFNGGGFVAQTSPKTYSTLTAGTYTWVVKDFNGCQISGSSIVNGPANCAHLFPTQTTCCNYLSPDREQFDQDYLCATVKGSAGSAISNVIPGVFFYYGDINVSSAGPQTVVIDQDLPSGGTYKYFALVNTSNVWVYYDQCQNAQVTSVEVDNIGNITIKFDAQLSGNYIISVKYDSKSIIGSIPGGDNTYSFGIEGQGGSYGQLVIDTSKRCFDTPGTLVDGCNTNFTSDPVAKIDASIETVGFDAYPVPFKDELTIKYKFDYKSDVKIEVFNASGMSVLSKTDTNSYLNKEVTLTLKVSKEQEQVYLVKVTTDRGTYTKKVMSSK